MSWTVLQEALIVGHQRNRGLAMNLQPFVALGEPVFLEVAHEPLLCLWYLVVLVVQGYLQIGQLEALL